MTTELVQEDVNQLLSSPGEKWPAEGGQFFRITNPKVQKPFDSFSKRAGSNCMEHAYPAARTAVSVKKRLFR